ncbi:hypothetical protein QQ39_17360 [Pragia fontium]|nr:hypothetical protein QQ39_17360 [Pragia fontium]
MIEEGLHIEGKKYVCSFTENEYLKNLITWFDKNCFINCQVSLGQLMIFPDQPGFSDEERKRFFSIYNSMTMDYVLVSKKTYQIVCVIELDDISHEKEERIERDKKLNELMSVAKIPLLHVPVSEMHVQPDIWGCRKAIKSS